MGTLRNFIDTIGIVDENDLLRVKDERQIVSSQVHNIYLSEDEPKVGTIFQTIISGEVKSRKNISYLKNKMYVLDCVSNIKILCTEKGGDQQANILNYSLPFNLTIDISEDINNIGNVDIFILDAFFELVSQKNIYCNIVYLVCIGDKNHVVSVSNCNKDIDYLDNYDGEYL